MTEPWPTHTHTRCHSASAAPDTACVRQQIVNNKVFGNKGNGMYIFEGGMGVLEGNDVFEN
eukprot:1346606-Rhodomonas_salina.1